MLLPDADTEAWKRMVLRSMPAPAWLSTDAPHNDVVLSSRARFMRNLAGYRFPNRAPQSELMAVMRTVLAAEQGAELHLEAVKGMTTAERDHLVGCRLISPDFQWKEPGRALLLDQARAVSIMINEEDHMRVQALTAGWSIGNAEALAKRMEEAFQAHLAFAHHPTFGFLSASPFNAGEGRRLSTMLHLIGLANSRRLPEVLKALNVKGITARGLFGESSRAVGAFLQVSVIATGRAEYVGAVDYLIREERVARRENEEMLVDKAAQVRDFVERSRTLSAAEMLRLVGWIRYAASVSQPWAPPQARLVDLFLSTVDLRPDDIGRERAAERADALRKLLHRAA